MSSEEFNVIQFFKNGKYEYVRRNVPAVQAVDALKHYTDNVAVKLGLIEKVIITDDLDYTVAEWKHGIGFTYPPGFVAATKGRRIKNVDSD